MKNYRFYLEYATPAEKRKGTVKNPGNHSGTVLALLLDDNNRPFYQGQSLNMDCISSVQAIPNSGVCFSGCSRGYLAENCRRIPERLARQIHPALFTHLEE